MRIMQQSPPQWAVSQRRLAGAGGVPGAMQTAAMPNADTLTLSRPVHGVRFGGKKEDQEALIEAAKTGKQAEVQKWLKKSGMDVNYQNQYGETALTLAASNGHTEIARMLLEKAAKTDLQNQHCNTALTLAAGGGAHGNCPDAAGEKG